MDATYCGDSCLADFVYGLLNWIGMNTLDGVPPIILECGSASQSARSRRWRSGRRRSLRTGQEAHEARRSRNNHPKIKEWNAAEAAALVQAEGSSVR